MKFMSRVRQNLIYDFKCKKRSKCLGDNAYVETESNVHENKQKVKPRSGT
jgi:hypothetical protein